jgi:5-dehydro-4-deoxyglucarate dehydratase
MVNWTQQLRGVIGFPATPMHDDLSVDYAALEHNVDFLARHAFCAICPTAGLGEIFSLTVEEAVAVVRVTVKTVAGRMPAIAGLGINAPQAVAMAKGMEQAGADALLVLPPYYVNAPESGLADYLKTVAAHTGLPLSFYSRDWAGLGPQQVMRLCEQVPSLAFWKDGQGDMSRYQRMMSIVGSRLIWLGGMGDAAAAAYFAIGCPAYTSSISCFCPEMAVAVAQAGLENDRERMDLLMHRYVQPLWALRDRSRGYEVSLMKAAMEMVGLKAGPVRPPLPRPSAQDLEDLRLLVERYREFAA